MYAGRFTYLRILYVAVRVCYNFIIFADGGVKEIDRSVEPFRTLIRSG